MKTKLLFIFFHTAAFLLISGCQLFDPDNGSSLEKGTFNVKVKGYIDRSFSGVAAFQTLRGYDGEHFFWC